MRTVAVAVAVAAAVAVAVPACLFLHVEELRVHDPGSLLSTHHVL